MQDRFEVSGFLWFVLVLAGVPLGVWAFRILGRLWEVLISLEEVPADPGWDQEYADYDSSGVTYSEYEKGWDP